MSGELLKLVGDRVEWRQIEDEVIALDLVRSEYLGLNATGSLLWPLLAEGTTQSALEAALVDRFAVDQAIAQRDVTAFVDELLTAGLLDRE